MDRIVAPTANLSSHRLHKEAPGIQRGDVKQRTPTAMFRFGASLSTFSYFEIRKVSVCVCVCVGVCVKRFIVRTPGPDNDSSRRGVRER